MRLLVWLCYLLLLSLILSLPFSNALSMMSTRRNLQTTETTPSHSTTNEGRPSKRQRLAKSCGDESSPSNNDDELTRIVYRIKLCETAEQAETILQRHASMVAHYPTLPLTAMPLFAKEKRIDLGLKYYRQQQESTSATYNEALRTWAVTILGKKDHRRALELLQDEPTPPSLATFHAALAACSQRSAWQDAMRVFGLMTHPTTLSVNTLLTCLAKAKEGDLALEILERCMSKKGGNGNGQVSDVEDGDLATTDSIPDDMVHVSYQHYPDPNRNAFQQTLRALLRTNSVPHAVQAYHLWRQMQEPPYNLTPLADYTSMVQQALLKGGREDLAHDMGDDETPFALWKCPDLIKVDKVKNKHGVYWKCGDLLLHQIVQNDASSTLPLTVALQPNRHAARNGIKLLFYRGHQKVAYLLMINAKSNDREGHPSKKATSKLLGLYLHPSLRGLGLAKVICAVWLRLCTLADVTPTTGNIHKPLLSLILEHTFGMQSMDGIPAELSAGEDGRVVLYSASKDLHGVLTPLDRKTQSVTLSSIPTIPRGRSIRVRGTFRVTNAMDLEERVRAVLSNVTFDCHVAATAMRKVLLGE